MAWASVAAGVSAVAVAKVNADAKAKALGAQIGMGQGMESMTDARSNEIVFDNSGWNVSFGNSKIDSEASKSVEQSGPSPSTDLSSSQSPYGIPVGGSGVSASLPPFQGNEALYVGLGAVVLVAVARKRKK